MRITEKRTLRKSWKTLKEVTDVATLQTSFKIP